jgi:hypothetical protein
LRRGTIRAALLSAGAALFLSAAAPAPAQTNISHTSAQSWYPRLRVDSQKNLHVVWNENYSEGSGDIYYAKYTKSSNSWGPAINLSNSGVCWSITLMLCGIDIDQSDRVYVVWADGGNVNLRTLSGGSWSGTETIGSGTAPDQARVACDATGNLYTAWYTQDGAIWSRARVNGSWESARRLNSGARSKFPEISVSENYVGCCWITRGGDIYKAVYAARSKSADSGWSSPREVAPNTGEEEQEHPVVEFLANDIAHIVYAVPIGPSRIVYHTRWTGSAFSARTPISYDTMLHFPALAGRGGYNLYTCWQTGGYGGGQNITYNILRSGTWSGQLVVPNTGGATFPDVIVDSSGTMHFVWDANGDIFYATATGEGTGEDGGGDPIENVPPVSLFYYSPMTGIAPLLMTFDGGGSTDVDGAIVSYDWVFGDGETAVGRTVNHTFQRRGSYQVQLTVVDDMGATGRSVQTVEVQGLYAPLNVAWQSYTDESLFQSRTVTDVTWAANPANDEIAPIIKYRVYRKKPSDDDATFKAYAEVSSSTFAYRDTRVSAPNLYSYAVSSIDAAGHESPLSGTSYSPPSEMDIKAKEKIRRELARRPVLY